MEVLLDIEANGLDPDTIHCFSTSTGCRGTTVEELRAALAGCTLLVGHNLRGYDLPVLERLWGFTYDGVVIDTLVLSRLSRPSRDGGHSLEAWGQRLGYAKVLHEDWDTYSPAMQHRCDEDVALNLKVYEALKEELKGFDQRSIDLEMRTNEIIQKQIANGCQFNEGEAMLLLAELRDRQCAVEAEVQDVFRPLPTPSGTAEPKYKANGELSIVGAKFLGDNWQTLGGPCTKVTYPEFNLGSNDQIARYLGRKGWKPKTLTPTGKAVVDEGALKDVEIPEAQLILEYKNLTKTIAMVSSWLEAQDDDGRIRGYVNSCGAVTGRMTHSKPNLAQVPARTKEGKRCRALFTVAEDCSLVGMDASGLELRMLAHYMADPGYTKEVVSGDVHSANQRAAGLDTRDQAKTFIYAFLYGAGDAKIGEIAGLRAKDGRALKQRFLSKTPALKRLIGAVEQASGRGYLKGLDGRRIAVRSRHAALNTLLQSAGAVVMKEAVVILMDKVNRGGLGEHARVVLTVHDEVQLEVTTKYAPAVAKLAEDAMREAGESFDLRCPLAGEAAIGSNWSETH